MWPILSQRAPPCEFNQPALNRSANDFACALGAVVLGVLEFQMAARTGEVWPGPEVCTTVGDLGSTTISRGTASGILLGPHARTLPSAPQAKSRRQRRR